ncbi:MAG: HlyD family type I secretion periplasmic adaptor subunit [Pseudomonadota bacterium]
MTTTQTRLWPWYAAGVAVSLALVGGVGGWAATARIDGAVIAPATIAVESRRKPVQHLEGGIVAELLVEDGALVAAGQPLIALDDVAARSELTAGRERLGALRIRHARLEAERGGDADPVLGPPGGTADPRLAQVIDGETRLFAARRDASQANRDLLERRILSLRARVEGEHRQRDAALEEAALLDGEIAALEGLLARQLVQSARVLELRRAAARLASDIAGFEARADSLEAEAAETAADLRRAEADRQAGIVEALAATQAEIVALEERTTVLADRLARSVIRAPEAGRVLDLAVNAPGEVIAPGQRVLEIVPQADRLVVEAAVSPADVERLSEGQAARVRLTGLNLNTTGELAGEVLRLSADVLEDPVDGQGRFTAIVVLDETAAGGAAVALLPGMPAEVLIATGERAAWSYLLRPLLDAYARSFRDD